MNKIIFECEVTTPMFLAGADGRKPELRAPSIKGAMRFWWRAAMGHLDLGELKRQEVKIFGGTGKGEGKSKISITVNHESLKKSDNPFPSHPYDTSSKGKPKKICILEYLAYGPSQYVKEKGGIVPVREYIEPGMRFSISITISKSSDSQEKIRRDVEDKFKMMSFFGGLGSRSRNGFGSFKILTGDGKEVEFQNNLTWNGSLPKYSAFSTDAMLWETKNHHNNWHSALAELGIAYKKARESLERKHEYKKRQYIGAPIQNSIVNRHAKPYFMSVHQGDNTYIGRILFLPSHYVFGHEKLNDRDETERFLDVCNSFNEHLDKELAKHNQ